MMIEAESFGPRLRDWRCRRRLSQLQLASDAEISTRHLSFIETGRAQPSREMVMRLTNTIGMPLRERNTLLLAAGYAPIFNERPLADPELRPAAEAIRLVLSGHEPWPALAVDRHWNLVEANSALGPYLEGAELSLLEPPINVLRLSLDPAGMGSRIVNYGEWRDHVLTRLRRSRDSSADPSIAALIDHLSSLSLPLGTRTRVNTDVGGVLVPMVLDTRTGRIAMFSTTMVFGTPLDVTLDEVAIESFFPADDVSASRMRELACTAS